MRYVGIIALVAFAAWVVLGNGYRTLKSLSKNAAQSVTRSIPKSNQLAKKTCTKCGAKMSQEFLYCTSCGAALPVPDAVSSNVAETNEAEKSHKFKLCAKVLLLAGIICFLCPFVQFSYRNNEIEWSVSGIEFVAGHFLSSTDKGLGPDGDSLSSPRVTVALLAGIAAFGFLLSFGDKAPLCAAALAIGAGIFLILFRENFLSFYGLTKDRLGNTKLEYAWGWFAAVFSFFAGGLISAYTYKTSLY